MEQKKILWIVAALGIFLLVIFLGTLLIYSPQQDAPTPMQVTTEVTNDTWVNTQAIQTQPTEPTVSTTPEATQADAASSVIQDGLLQTGDVTVISQGTTTVVTQDGITTIDLSAIEKSVAASTVEPAVKPIATRLPATTPSTTKVTEAQKETSTPAKPAVVKPVAPAKPVDQYWVQAASFVSKANADKARSSLVAQKIPAEVFTHSDNDGVTFYRVRVGPYTTKSEAEYWNTLIKTVDSFADAKSYVTNTAKPVK